MIALRTAASLERSLARRASALALLVVSFALAALVIRFQPYVDHEIRALGAAAYPIAIAVFAIVASAPFSVTDALAIMNARSSVR